MSLKDLQREIHDWAMRNGFYEPDKVRDVDGMLMNVVTEVAEAQEEWRAGHDVTKTYWTNSGDLVISKAEQALSYQDFDTLPGSVPNLIRRGFKPEGFPTELADIVIRVLDMCEYLGIDIEHEIDVKMLYNESRAYRNGGKRS